MCVHTSPGTEGVVEAKLVPVLVGKLLGEDEEIKVCVQCKFSAEASWPLAGPAVHFRGGD